MTDLRLTLGLLTGALIFGLLIGLWGLVLAVQDWRAVQQSGINGPRQVIAQAAIRRNVFRLLMQFGLIWLYGARSAGGPASPFVATVVGLVLVFALTAESIMERLDRRLLRWFLRDRL